MKYALINGKRTESFPKGRATCPVCGEMVIAKHGIYRAHHWSHKADSECEHWADKETQWHIDWQNKFPDEWHEYIQHDQSGEKHIADVRTIHGLVIEFQHSHLDPQERAKRERFYGNMVWIVDGTRLKGDYPRFQKGIGSLLTTTNKKGHLLVPNPELCFPADWSNSSVPVLFDFLGDGLIDPTDEQRKPLWCLLPNLEDKKAVVIKMSREHFIETATKGPQVRQEPAPVTLINRQPQVQRVVLNADLLRALPPDIYRQLTRRPKRWQSPRL